MYITSNYTDRCGELHIGNTPRSIMTKGNSVTSGTQYGNFVRGNRDKLMISYRRESSHDYTMLGACSVLFENKIHFFGGNDPSPNGFYAYYYDYNELDYDNSLNDFTRQHFVIETQRSGQLIKMTRKEDLEIGFLVPACSSFEIKSKHFPWFKTNVVILCFGSDKKACYSFDGKLTYIGDSNFSHDQARLTKYNGNLLTIGDIFKTNWKTEIMKMDENKNFNWSVVESIFNFFGNDMILYRYSLVTVEYSDFNEEYVLLISEGKVFKFDGTWFPFGKLKKPRYEQNAIFWNGALYIIGGRVETDEKMKMEIWNVKDSPHEFTTTENWPQLFDWKLPHLLIVPDSFFPDY